MDKPVRVVIVDSGIYTSRSDLKRYVSESTGIRINEEGYIIEDPDMEAMHEHGTGIALIIRYFCKQIEIISINILNEKLVTDGRVMIQAIAKALERNPDIVHMSLGTTKKRYKKSIKKLVEEAAAKDILIVSAAHNEGVESYPAYIEGVVCVAAGSCDDGMIRYKDGIFFAPPVQGSMWRQEEMQNIDAAGSSISAAYVTGCIAALKKSRNFRSNTELLENFKDICCDGIPGDGF